MGVARIDHMTSEKGQKLRWTPSWIGVRFAPDSRHDTRSIDLRLRDKSESGRWTYARW